MQVNFKVKTLDAQTHDFSVDDELTVREFKDLVAGKTNISAEQQRIIYCGRVLADERHLREFNLEGKVVHVAERPPPSQTELSGGGNAARNDGNGAGHALGLRPRAPAQHNLRNSPLFRALDGIMGNVQVPAGNALTSASSSSFCMNRITVARHMLDCANNIIAFLEDPNRGLNNPSLDILTRGRWTMESTVVEVGITAAELPQNHIVEMVQGAVNAALRGNGNTNVTVVQLPNVFGLPADGSDRAAGANNGPAGAGRTGGATVYIEESDENGGGSSGGTGTTLPYGPADLAELQRVATNAVTREYMQQNRRGSEGNAADPSANNGADRPTVPAGGGGGSNDDSRPSTNTTGTNTENANPRRQTGTTVLAEVIQHMRTVQERMAPFLQQFYDLLAHDPNFEENDTEARERSQNLYNRVSEVMHYMSHAQHAISDLMLDMGQPTPRYLTCRPILVEQSGYVSTTNNYNISAAAAVNAAIRQAQQQQQQQQQAAQQVPAAAAAPTVRSRSAVRASSAESRNRGDGLTAAVLVPQRLPVVSISDLVVDNGGSATTRRDTSLVGPPAAAAQARDSTPTGGRTGDGGGGDCGASAGAGGGLVSIDDANSDADLSDTSNSLMSQGSTSSADDTLGEFMLTSELFVGGATDATAASAANAATAASATVSQQPLVPDNANVTVSVNVANNDNVAPVNPTIGMPQTLNANQQMHMARLLQAVLRNAPVDTEFTVQISPPSILSIDIPVEGGPGGVFPANTGEAAADVGAAAPPAADAAAGASATSTTARPTTATAAQSEAPSAGNRINVGVGTSPAGTGRTITAAPAAAVGGGGRAGGGNGNGNGNGNNVAGSNQARVISMTLPTTSTQTRSTSRPQIQINNLPTIGPFQGRFVPTNTSMVTSFDRFLPCNSHHISETNVSHVQSRVLSTPDAFMRNLRSRQRRPFTGATARSMETTGERQHRVTRTRFRRTLEEIPAPPMQVAIDEPDLRSIHSSIDRFMDATTLLMFRKNLRLQFLSFMHCQLFNEAIVNAESTTAAITRADECIRQFLVFLPQYQRNGVDVTASVLKLCRRTLYDLIDLMKTTIPDRLVEFERSLAEIFKMWRRRLYSVLQYCLGDAYAQVSWPQLMREFFGALSPHLKNEGLHIIRAYLSLYLPNPVCLSETKGCIVRRLADGDESSDSDDEMEGAAALPADGQSGAQSSAASTSGSTEKANADATQGAPTNANNSSSSSSNPMNHTLGATGAATDAEAPSSSSASSSNEVAETSAAAVTVAAAAAAAGGDASIVEPAGNSTSTATATSTATPAAPSTPANTPDAQEAVKTALPAVATATASGAIPKANSAAKRDTAATKIPHPDEGAVGGADLEPVAPPPAAPLTFPIVPRGSHPWHHRVPTDWVDCITHDVSEQQAPAKQSSYSDSYISGMSLKRRKLIKARKPPTDIKRLIAACATKAVQRVAPIPNPHACVGISGGAAAAAAATTATTTGASTSAAAASVASGTATGTAASAAPAPRATILSPSARAAQNNRLNQQICNAIGEENSVRAGLIEQVRNHVAERFKRNPDYKPEKFPKCAAFGRK